MTRHSSLSFKTILVNNQVRLNARATGMPGPEAWRSIHEPVAEPADSCTYLESLLGFDGAVGYHAGDVSGQMASFCPSGIDVHFYWRCDTQAGDGEARYGDSSVS